MKQKTTIIWGAMMGGLAVAIGAFGAHALKAMLQADGREDTFELAVRYQFYHSLAMLIVGLLARTKDSKLLEYSSLFFLIGILIFCGSLYVLCLTSSVWLGAITPIGGICFLAGWILLVVAMVKASGP
jgi:uncharacterized membrane protein YgdD (TMEM256/DUF423 family)